ncbi:acyl-CoA N-acyltransferase, partial [Elsinoe ampelina]
NISILPFSKEHISPFKRINALLLPIPYGNSFYDEILSDQLTASISLVATWTDDSTSLNAGKVIGGIRCRILSSASTGIEKGIASSFPSYAPGSGHRIPADASSGPEGEKILYISTLTLLSPYRGHGVAKALLERVEQVAKVKYGVSATGAHVWVANDDGLQWYAKRGFKQVGRDDGYYRRLDPMGAVVMRR